MFPRLTLLSVLLLPIAAWAADLEKEKDKYVWVGMDSAAQMDADLILAYSKDGANGTGRTIAFGDSHVEFVKAADIPKRVATCNAKRQQLGLKDIVIPATNAKP